MSNAAITIENIGKRYKLGPRAGGDGTFYEALVDWCTAPLRRLRYLGEQTAGEELFWALREVSLEVQPGEVVGIIGQNGAGKSTLLKILSRITEPTTGRALIHGRVRSLLEVGTGFHPELTGRENVYLNGAILGMKKAEIDRKFDEIVTFAGVEKFLDTPVKRYSSGMYVRLAFAVAAHLEPEILLVDEVLAVGDAGFQQKCLGTMGQVARAGRTVLFVSHNMSAVSELCARVVLIDGGRVTAQGEPDEMIRRYLASMSALAETPIAQRSDRTGGGAVRFVDARLVVDGQWVTSVRHGEDMVVELTYVAPRAMQPRSTRFSISVSTIGNTKFIAFDTAAVQCHVREIHECGVIRCRIPRCPLLRGRYKLTLYAEVNGVVADRLPDALEFEVVSGGYPTVGWVTTEHEWQCANN